MKISFKKYTKHIVTLSLLTGLVISIYLQLKSWDYIRNLSSDNNKLYKDFTISEQLDRIILKLSIIESSQRGYVITGEEDFLKNYELNEAEVSTSIAQLKENLILRGFAKEYYLFNNLVDEKLAFADKVIHLFNTSGEKAAIEEIDGGKGRRIMESILILTNDINAKVKQSLDVMKEEERSHASSLQVWSVAGTASATLVAIIAIFLLYRDIRQRDILQARINDALLQARNSVQIKEHFMANMSHEIRTPMNSVLGFTEFLQKTRLDKTQSEYVSAIQSSGSNLLNIINDILDFSKIEAGMVRFENVPFSVSDLIGSLEILFSKKASEKSLILKVDVDERIPELVLGDPYRLTQILSNLINNAIKFTEKGVISLDCAVKRTEKGYIWFSFSVKDTGIGIPNGKRVEIFERFNQGNIETTRKFGGTGLGLSIVKNLVELQKGEILLNSTEGKGSEFIVKIRYQLVDNESLNEAMKPPGNLPDIARGTFTLLLVEDNAMNQKYISIILNEMGVKYDIASNGQLAIELLQTKSYDIILMDIQMPVLDGYNTSIVIRNELNIKVPIIAMTAHIMAGEKEKCLGYGMNDYISKPFKGIDLNMMILKNLFGIQDTIKNSTEESGLSIDEISDENVVNLDEIHELSKGDRSFVDEMISIFIEQAPEDTNMIESAIRTNDFQTIRAVSHKLRSSVGFVGLNKYISEPLRKIELFSEKSVNIEEIMSEFVYVKAIISKAILELIEIQDRSR